MSPGHISSVFIYLLFLLVNIQISASNVSNKATQKVPPATNCTNAEQTLYIYIYKH